MKELTLEEREQAIDFLTYSNRACPETWKEKLIAKLEVFEVDEEQEMKADLRRKYGDE